MQKWISIFFSVAALGGCASVPDPLRGDFSGVTQQQAVERNLSDQRVRWGGAIIETRPGEDETCFQIIGRELNDSARPVSDDNTRGRFIACAPGFYDPVVFEEGRELTVMGTLDTPVTREIGDYNYRFPRVSAEQVYLWPEQGYYTSRPYHYNPLYARYYPGYYSPFFYGYYGPIFVDDRFRERPPPDNGTPAPSPEPDEDRPIPPIPDFPGLATGRPLLPDGRPSSPFPELGQNRPPALQPGIDVPSSMEKNPSPGISRPSPSVSGEGGRPSPFTGANRDSAGPNRDRSSPAPSFPSSLPSFGRPSGGGGSGGGFTGLPSMGTLPSR